MPVVACFLAGGSATAARESAPIVRVVFRYDDFSNRTPLEFDRRLIDAFQSRGMSATFGVIPFERDRQEGEPYYTFPRKVLPLRPEKAELLAGAVRAGTVEAALHGYVHLETAPERPWTEFAALPREDQERKLVEGHRSLEAVLPVPPVSFVPPFNTYDETTLEILEDLGFTILSAGGIAAPPRDSPLRFLPATCELRLRQVRGAVDQARRSGEATPLVVVMCHPHDFLEVDQDHGVMEFDEFSQLLDWLGSQDDVRVCTLVEAVDGSGRALSAAHYRNFCTLRPDRPYHRLPSVLKRGCSEVHYYPTKKSLAAIRTRRTVRLAALYGGIALVGLLLACLVLAWLPRLAGATAWLGLAAVAGLGVVAFGDRQVYFRGAASVAGVAGVCLGAWIRYLTRRARADAATAAEPGKTELGQREPAATSSS